MNTSTSVSLSGNTSILILSDLHLTPRFDNKKYLFLSKLINEASVIVLNGDIWDGYITSLEEIIASPWQEFLTALQVKQTYYLYGNHDPHETDETLYDQFCQWHGNSLELTYNNRQYHIEHGNNIAHSFDNAFFNSIPKRIKYIGSMVELLLVQLFGQKILKMYRSDNQAMRLWASQKLSKDVTLICGHSHLAEYSPDDHFANTGMIRWGLASYLTLDSNGLCLHYDRY